MNRRTVTRISISVIGILGTTLSVRSAQQKTEFTYPEFRASVREQSSPEKLQANLERAGEIFARLLAAQGKEAAARQSLDRLSGWHKSVLARVQAQSAPAADEEQLRFAEANAVAHVAQFEAERREALREANVLLKTPPDSAMVALLDTKLDTKNVPAQPASALQASGASGHELNPDVASRKAQFEKELLPLGTELLGKMYQSYLFGGVPLTALLWQEQQVYRTELEYRLLLVEAERRP